MGLGDLTVLFQPQRLPAVVSGAAGRFSDELGAEYTPLPLAAEGPGRHRPRPLTAGPRGGA